MSDQKLVINCPGRVVGWGADPVPFITVRIPSPDSTDGSFQRVALRLDGFDELQKWPLHSPLDVTITVAPAPTPTPEA